MMKSTLKEDKAMYLPKEEVYISQIESVNDAMKEGGGTRALRAPRQ